MVLSIIIPAYNEAEAIGNTIQTCLNASTEIRRETGLEVEIIVVSDGSTDATADIARSFAGVSIISYAKNRGYGAALMTGFEQARGELLAFLDADGTCDPMFFIPLCKAILNEGAEITLGSRLHSSSKMPRIRRVGNRMFAALLCVFSGKLISDTASGMRVMRREALARLCPLPTGLDFTPAMSSRAILSGVQVREIPMPYAERVGQSKLRVVQDGVGFLRSIFSGVLCYRPERILQLGALACLFVGALLALYPLEHFARHGSLADWMIYRSLASFLCFLVSLQCFIGFGIVREMWRIGPHRAVSQSPWAPVHDFIFSRGVTLAVSTVLFLGAVLVSQEALLQYLDDGKVYTHWSKVLVSTLLALQAIQILGGRLLMEVLGRWSKVSDNLRAPRLSFTPEHSSPLHAHPPSLQSAS